MARKNGVSIKTTIYQKFRGADFSTDPALVDKTRSPLCTNMISDNGGMPEKRPGWRTVHSFTGADGTPLAVHGIFCNVSGGRTFFYAHAGGKVFSWEGAAAPVERLSGLRDAPGAVSRGMQLCGKLWIVTGGEYLCCQGEDVHRVDAGDCYIPTTIITREPNGGGVSYEDVNMLTPFRRNGFQTDGSTKAFLLDGAPLDTVFDAGAALSGSYKFDDDSAHGGHVWYFSATAAAGDELRLDLEAKTFSINGVEAGTISTDAGTVTGTPQSLTEVCQLSDKSAVTAAVWGQAETNFTVCRETGTVTFATAPAAPGAGAADGLTVTFPRTVPGYADTVNKCSIITAFGAGSSDRIFLSGNPEHPNQDYYSGLNDPTYFPDLGYSDVGIEGVPILGYHRIGSNQAIIKADNGQDSTVFFRSAAVSERGAVSFSLQQGIAGVGAASPGSFANLLDEPLFLAGTGVFGVTVNYLTGERAGQNRSYYLNAKLVAEDLARGEAVSWMGMYLLSFPNGHVYVLDGKQTKTYRSESLGDYCYEGYYWEHVPACCWLKYEQGGKEYLFFGTSDGRVCLFYTADETVARFSDDGEAISAVWATKFDDDGDPTILKTMLKRGCAVSMKPYYRSSAQICLRTDKDVVDRPVRSDTIDIFNWEDIDFGRFSFDSNDAAREIFLNTKVKNYKRLQILVRNNEANEGFGVYGITKHFVFGNYAKR